MLTGTASTGMILLREADPDFESPASENLVYQTLPAIVLGFPLLIISAQLYTHARSLPLALGLLAAIIAIFIALNLFLFRKFIFRKKTVGAGSGR
jgi:ESS family glutamate:Na+ symporter